MPKNVFTNPQIESKFQDLSSFASTFKDGTKQKVSQGFQTVANSFSAMKCQARKKLQPLSPIMPYLALASALAAAAYFGLRNASASLQVGPKSSENLQQNPNSTQAVSDSLEVLNDHLQSLTSFQNASYVGEIQSNENTCPLLPEPLNVLDDINSQSLKTFIDPEESKFISFNKITLVNGDVYEGEFKDGVKEGKGKLIFFEGGIYDGDFKDDQASGKGKLILPNGEVYEGDFRGGINSGRAKFTRTDDCWYDAIWYQWKDTNGEVVEHLSMVIQDSSISCEQQRVFRNQQRKPGHGLTKI